ncbi:MAG: YbaN family protein [Pseudomonadota bacterium]
MKAYLYKPLGFFFLALGLLGIALPLLPTTPFVLLAAWCFARSSERWHQRLLASELFGPMIRNWERNRCVSCRTKTIALISMLAVGGASIIFALDGTGLRLAAGVLLTIGCTTICLVKTCAPTVD